MALVEHSIQVDEGTLECICGERVTNKLGEGKVICCQRHVKSHTHTHADTPERLV